MVRLTTLSDISQMMRYNNRGISMQIRQGVLKTKEYNEKLILFGLGYDFMDEKEPCTCHIQYCQGKIYCIYIGKFSSSLA